MERYDYLIVGAGLFGATFAHQAHARGKRVLVIDRRAHLGGNLHCVETEGIRVHRYGAHIFHTSDERVWRFVNGICPFNRYTNRPIAISGGRVWNLPFNMNTFSRLWGVKTPAEAQKILDEQRRATLEKLQLEGAKSPRNLEEQAMMLVGEDLYRLLVKGYTEKQWGRDCRDLPPEIIRRIPVRMTYDNNYFDDTYQGVPMGGYNRLIDGLLEGVECRTGVDYFDHKTDLDRLAKAVVYTGPIDRYFGYALGKLEYRTVRFETEVYDVANYQGNAVVNYTDHSVGYTRSIEHKHFEALTEAQVNAIGKTVVSREYAVEWTEGMEPYYPVGTTENERKRAEYMAMAQMEKHVLFGGRLAEYRYYDMAPIVGKVLSLWSGGGNEFPLLNN